MYLESVAILPQLFMLSKTGAADVITTHYLFLIGCYRVLYVLNWIYRFYTEHYFDLIAVVAGVTQTVLYLDFFYLYITKGLLQDYRRFLYKVHNVHSSLSLTANSILPVCTQYPPLLTLHRDNGTARLPDCTVN